MSESQLWSYLRDKVIPQGGHFTRVENDAGGDFGFPDVHYTYSGHTGTIELKFLRKRKLPFGNDGLRPSQKLWITAELEAGGKVLIVAQVRDKIFVLPGEIYSQFNEFNELLMAHYSLLTLRQRKITHEVRADFARLL